MELRPRQYAEKILCLETKEERQEYLNTKVPDKFREWVRFYVRSWWPYRERVIRNAKNRIKPSE